jgi:hypothetical protein
MMSWIGKISRRVWLQIRRHRWRTGLIVVVVAVGIAAIIKFWPVPSPPCGPGMSLADNACIGVDLASGPISKNEPAEMGALEADIKANNDIRTSDGKPSQDYISIVLLQNMSPVAGIDTRSYPDVYPDIEGAITAAWRANHTAAVGSLPKVKLFLGNMGSQYTRWSDAVDQIAANAAANHITAVIGLGQSTDATRSAAARIVDKAHLPVIGATVSGDTMNFYPNSTRRNNGFFRVTATNTDLGVVAARFIASIEPDQTHVAIVQDNVAGDDYNQTLARAADSNMPGAHRFPFTSPGSTLPPGTKRSTELIQLFSYLDQNVCSVAPKVIYFAARGADLGAFVQSWTQGGTPCANSNLTVVTGDDGGAAINDPAVHQAVRSGRVRVLFTAESSADQWGPCPAANVQRSADQISFDTFQAAFSGQPDVCAPHQHVIADDGAAPLSFGLPDLRSGEAMLAQDAGIVAITAARQADRDADNAADGGIVVRDPYSQVGFIEEMRCTNKVQGASGVIQFSQDPASYGNPIAKPVPIVEINADGTTSTLPAGPGIAAPTDPAATC